MRAILFVLLSLYLSSMSATAADNLVIVTMDGMRWQEVFNGIDPVLTNNEKFTRDGFNIKSTFDAENNELKRQKLMPFLWNTVVQQGVITGNQNAGSSMLVSNNWWFSYPGYNELLTGKADNRINSNQAIDNKNVTMLEWLNQQSGFKYQVAVFGSWDVFPAIINQSRSKLMINAGFMPANWPGLSTKAQWLNQLQQQVPSPWHNVRLDAFTAGFASEYIAQHKPRVIYLALGETDDFAHDGHYDQLIADLWQQLQSIPQYKNNTNLIITSDHGRGNNEHTWQHHASLDAIKGYMKELKGDESAIVGSNEIWMAAMGPDIKKMGEWQHAPTLYLNQIAATALNTLKINPDNYASDIGKPVTEILK
ncbi:alkaline phosphatase family protein [Neptunicella marina]|uniref:Alkaline phosphatase family protein n=1 Tax=Neptunicella marina TaxID=2125989 RepID=A0A8J6LZZ9_9ALTE|nr:alkaline phosphatase family protein [Neptunicella marina]MBC3764527.1 alkaline phosphatase family protein [Neptunicella marina]